MKIELSVPEVVDVIKEIQKHPERLFDVIRVDVQQAVAECLNRMMVVEMSDFLGRQPYERVEGKANHRNGSYGRNFTLKGIGEVQVRVPRDRKGEYNTAVLPRSKQYEDKLREDIALMFLTGVSTRSLSMISKRLLGRTVSHAEVSNATREMTGEVEKWRNRDLSQEVIKYLFVDGVCFPMRIDGSVESVPVLVALGVTETGGRLVLGLQSGDKESASNWREFFKDLKQRGLDTKDITLGVMDGLPGLEKVFKEEFPKAKVQRCQIHVARNVLAKVPRKLKQSVADDMRSVFYASTRAKALDLFSQFKKRWENQIPSATKCLENSLGACLIFFDYPEDEWISLRTTNLIERLNKEFKRRTRPMEILAGEDACYTLLAFVSLKMELHWRSNPVGKVRKNLPFFRTVAVGNFTQKI